MSDESELTRAVREWHRQVPVIGAGAALNAFITALAKEAASAGTIIALKAELDLIEEQRRRQQEPPPDRIT
ncbi:hypothetical protein [Streptomyces sp. H39-C1]|uniref:hypothetical protein n=1 Tax=Streptomyces sp. H39-C1 TaxID=3004355 RepID=UPI0022AFC2A9|nr:hypothetical protein [Streptomyces sp. H39-C1]MCZ4098075.1 hypothetical protein [Streptomyces sp. H39-C1]